MVVVRMMMISKKVMSNSWINNLAMDTTTMMEKSLKRKTMMQYKMMTK
jgi:hypothetical protein